MECITKTIQREDGGGGDVLDGNVMRGPEKRDKKVGGEWARGYKAFYHRNKLAGTRGGI